MTRFITWTAALVLGFSVFVSAAPNEAEYAIGIDDVLTVSVWRYPDLSGTFTVGADGAVAVPLLGAVDVKGMTARQVEGRLRQRLSEGYVKEPQVTVTVQTYRSQRVFVTGEVRQPGAIPLSGSLSLLEAIARVGPLTDHASHEVIVSRPVARDAARPQANAAASQFIRVDLRKLQEGDLAGNIDLMDGDTVLVPRAPLVHVMGEVRLPGDYAIRPSTTIAEVLSRAGGATERGSIGRVRILRAVEGKRKEIKVGLEDTVEEGDVVLIMERLF